MPPSFDLDPSIDALRRTPSTIEALLDGLDDQGCTLKSLLQEFAALRAGNLALLRSWRLTERELDLPGEHPSLGPVTLRQLLASWVVHDLGHVAQVVRVMAKQYGGAVGPWVPYLPVLTDHPVPRS